MVNLDLLDMPIHFEQNYRILLLFLEKWQQHLFSTSQVDCIDHNIILLSKITKLIKNKQFNKKLIIAGTTCSRPSTLELVKAAYKNKNCQIILHGIDEFSSDEVIDTLHPQHLFSRLTKELKVNTSSIFSYSQTHCSLLTNQKSYLSIFSLANREKFDDKSLAGNAKNLKIIETEDEFEEVKF